MYILNIKYSRPDRKNFKILVEISVLRPHEHKKGFAKCMSVYLYA